jgi:hypothetical protein
MPLPVVQKDQALQTQAHASLKAPLEPIEEGGGGLPEGEAVAFGGGQGWGGGERDHLQVLAAEGCRGCGPDARGR